MAAPFRGKPRVHRNFTLFPIGQLVFDVPPWEDAIGGNAVTYVLPNRTFHGSGFWLLSEGGDPMTRLSTPRFLAVFLVGTVLAAQAPPGGPGDLGPVARRY